MTFYDQVFYALHIPLIPAWTLLFFAPHAQITRKLVHSALVPLILGAAYFALLMSGTIYGQSAENAGMTSLGGVMALFSHPVGTLTGWTHFLIFDLFIGAWIVRDAKTIGISHRTTLPALFLTLVFGPTGLMVYLLERILIGKKVIISIFRLSRCHMSSSQRYI